MQHKILVGLDQKNDHHDLTLLHAMNFYFLYSDYFMSHFTGEYLNFAQYCAIIFNTNIPTEALKDFIKKNWYTMFYANFILKFMK